MLVLKKKRKIQLFQSPTNCFFSTSAFLFWVIFQKFKIMQFSSNLPCGGAADIMTEASTSDTKDILFNGWTYFTK